MFGDSDVKRFLWAKSWLDEGDPVETPEPGDIVVFDFGAGDQHVTLFENDRGDGHWECLGGNQSHQVRLVAFPAKSAIGIRRPSPSMQAGLGFMGVTVSSGRFPGCVELVLASEGGNVDDPRDRGGRTSRGITQDDWDKWRRIRPGLPADVFQAPQDQILAIYHDNYWDAVEGDQLPTGVDYAVFDCGVLNGVATAARILQTRLGVAVDGEIGPNSLSACRRAERATLINQICDDRLQRMRGLSNWTTYGRGWTDRVNRVRADALKMIGAPVSLPAPAAGGSFSGAAPGDVSVSEILQALKRLEDRVSSLKDIPAQNLPVSVGPAPADQAALARWVQQAVANFQAMTATTRGTVAAQASAQDLTRQFASMLTALSGLPAAAKAETISTDTLGPVNGALGQTIGNLLNGRKSAIGIIGAAATGILSGAPTTTAIGKLAADVAPDLFLSAGSGSVFLPLFLAMTAWGVLGKMEKWATADGGKV